MNHIPCDIKIRDLEKERDRLRSRVESELFQLKAGLCIEINNLEKDRQKLLEGIKVAREALDDILGWCETVKESGIRYVSLGAGSIILQNKDKLTTLNSLVEKYK